MFPSWVFTTARRAFYKIGMSVAVRCFFHGSYTIQTALAERYSGSFHDETPINNRDECERAVETAKVDVVVQGLQGSYVCSAHAREGIRT
jgi:hypothetical protein